MESLIHQLFFHQWQRKWLALLTATVIWIFVNHSITSSKTLPSVPIRVINIPVDKTIPGLLSNGFLSKRTSLTLTGTKDVIDQLEPGDVEVLLDLSNLPSGGVLQITKKQLVSLNPNFNLPKHVNSVAHPELLIKMSPLLTEQIPVIVQTPSGSAPQGYAFLDIWPLKLLHTVSGPQEQVLALKKQGLEFTFNLNDLTKGQLDAIHGEETYDDEISFYLPDAWKKIETPFSTRGAEMLNDPEAKSLHVTFLREKILPLSSQVPLQIFYPLKYSDTLNPSTYPLAPSRFVSFQHHLPVLTLPLFARRVGKLFLEIVQDNLELEIVAAPPEEKEKLAWSVSLVDEPQLEEAYVTFLLNHYKNREAGQESLREREHLFRQRFRLYAQRLALYISPQHKLELEGRLGEQNIEVHVPNTLVQSRV